jgi:hypothetical protein
VIGSRGWGYRRMWPFQASCRKMAGSRYQLLQLKTTVPPQITSNARVLSGLGHSSAIWYRTSQSAKYRIGTADGADDIGVKRQWATRLGLKIVPCRFMVGAGFQTRFA